MIVVFPDHTHLLFLKSMPVVQGVLTGKGYTILWDTGYSSALVRKELVKNEQ